MGLFGSILGGVTSLLGGNSASKAASKAADAQVKAAQLGVDESRRQFDATRASLNPWIQTGTSALGGLADLLGISTPATAGAPGQADYAAYVQANPDLIADYQNNYAGKMSLDEYGRYHYGKFGQTEGRNLPTAGGTAGTPAHGGPGAQQAAIDALEASPMYQSLYRNGEEAVLANASATGGLRGGNTQRSLYNLGADTLAQVIQQQIANLGGIAGQGQSAAAGLGGLGAQNSSQIAGLLGQQGSAQASGSLAKGGISASSFAGLANALRGLNLGGGFRGTGYSQASLDAGQIF